MFNYTNDITTILCSLSIMLFAGFLLTRLSKLLKLPYVSGYIISGILIGPYVLKLIPTNIISNMGFLSDIALAFIAFNVGKFFKLDIIKNTGIKVIIITLFESLLAGIVVTLAMHWLFNLSWDFSLVLGAIATATAPASTTMTIRQYKARGHFVDILLQIVALDDVLCLLIFSVVTAICTGNAGGSTSALDVILPIIYNIAVIGLGAICGWILSKLLTPKRSQDNRLILAVAMLLALSGICGLLDISPLLSCMICGATYINLTKDSNLYKQLDNFTPPILSLFFILSGMKLDVSVLKTVGIIGVVYFIIRIVGKYLGSYLGALITKEDKKTQIYLGLAMIPQAGVAIGLAYLGQRLLPTDLGNLLLTIILSSSVLYELVGPISAKIALVYSGAIPKQEVVKEEDKTLINNLELKPSHK
ncbi:MAG: cation:proton antiporter [Bacilli bacterium]|nr:cation:proton antiporter [Bacilli bacterium]